MTTTSQNKLTWDILIIIFFISVLILFQLGIFITGSFPHFNSDKTQSYLKKINDGFSGNILFTGDSGGFYELTGCERIGSTSRRAALLNKFTPYVYLDFGNFTSAGISRNKTTLPLIAHSYLSMHLNAINLTEKDWIHLNDTEDTREDKSLHFLPFVSANLEIKDNNFLGNEIPKFIFIPFLLTRKSESKEIILGITGITEHAKRLYGKDTVFSVREIIPALKEVKPLLSRTDIKILLFDGSFFSLKKMINENDLGFDLVISNATLPDHVDKCISINNTRVFTCDEHGRSLSNIRVIKYKDGYNYIFDTLITGMGAPEDEGIKSLIMKMEQEALKRKKLEKKP